MNSGDVNVSADIAKDKYFAATSKQQKLSEQQKQDSIQKQDPSQTTGVQWAYNQASAQALNAQNPAQAGLQQGKQPAQAVETKGKPQIVAPELDDLAILSTTVSTHEESVKAPVLRTITDLLGIKFNMPALEETYKEYFKKSKSHNLLLERFMANIKFSGMQMLLSALGMSAEEQARIQGEVREEALKEINLKLSQDWAYTKAMIEITS